MKGRLPNFHAARLAVALGRLRLPAADGETDPVFCPRRARQEDVRALAQEHEERRAVTSQIDPNPAPSV